MLFEELDLNDDLLDALYDMHFETCTPVQERAIPLVLEGRDLLASAQTGTGKTAAYLLPILEKLSRGEHRTDKVNALILVPTRELAMQVDQLLEGFAYYSNVSWIAVSGGNDGVAFAQQQRAFAKGSDIVVATPGRLLALLRYCEADLSGVDCLVLDEADRMLDIGFYDDIIEIISHLPKQRQTLMFSATFPRDVEKLARNVLTNPAEVKIAVSKPADGITQGVYLLQETQKLPLIKTLFAEQNLRKNTHLCRIERESARPLPTTAPTAFARGTDAQRLGTDRTHASNARLQKQQGQNIGRHRRGVARHRHRRHRTCHQLRCAQTSRRLCAPHRTHGTRRSQRHRSDVCYAQRPPTVRQNRTIHRKTDRTPATARRGCETGAGCSRCAGRQKTAQKILRQKTRQQQKDTTNASRKRTYNEPIATGHRR